jgi:hypothetical protein
MSRRTVPKANRTAAHRAKVFSVRAAPGRAVHEVTSVGATFS